RDGRIEFSWLYNLDLFDRCRMEQMADRYVRLLETVMSTPGEQLGRVKVLEKTEEHRMVQEWNQTERADAGVERIQQLFEEQAARRPDWPAVVCGERSVSYGELNREANRLGRYLREAGVRAEEVVGIYCRRSERMVTGMLATLKAGGAYVPLEV